jgi:hypothetical protein
MNRRAINMQFTREAARGSRDSSRATLRAMKLVKLITWCSISFAVLAAGAPRLAAAAPTVVPAFAVTGSLAVNEPDACDSAGINLTQNTTVSWTACHALKEHHDLKGNPITTNSFVATALTPVPATIQVQVSCTYAGGSSDWPPKVFTSQTDVKGNFSVAVPQFSCGAAGAQGVGMIVSALLSHDISDSNGKRIGTVRAVWDQALGEQVYNSILSASQPPLYMTTDAGGQFPTTVPSPSNHDWVIPQLVLSSSPVTFPMPAKVALGAQNFDVGTASDYLDYVRAMMQAFHTVVSLHRKLQALLPASTYAQMFLNPALDVPTMDAAFACDHCYSLMLAAPGGTDGGGYRFFTVAQPQTFVGTSGSVNYATMISWGLPGHELGHSIAATLALNTFGVQDNTMQGSVTPDGTLEAFHTVDEYSFTLQLQEMGQAMTEGIADAMGSFFLNDCSLGSADARLLGDLNPVDNMWDPQQFAYCDGSPGCPFGAFRFQMSQRQIAPGSAAWNTRLARLTALAQQAAALGGNFVTSNNEAKYRNFFCDLLVPATASWASGLVGGKSYVADYLWTAAEILDGRQPTVTVQKYASDPTHQNVVIPMATLFSTLNNFIPGVNNVPNPLPTPLWEAGHITDGANQTYDNLRLSVKGLISPQAFGMFLVNQGVITKSHLNNILAMSLMDQVN